MVKICPSVSPNNTRGTKPCVYDTRQLSAHREEKNSKNVEVPSVVLQLVSSQDHSNARNPEGKKKDKKEKEEENKERKRRKEGTEQKGRGRKKIMKERK